MIVLVVLGGLVMALALTALIAGYRFLKSDRGRVVVGVLGDGYQLIKKARSAPGTRELRQMGCNEAMVMDADDLRRMLEKHVEDARADAGASPFGDYVYCKVSLLTKPLACNDVARKYVAAAGARRKSFIVAVEKAGGGAYCTEQYDGTGTVREGTSEALSLPEE